MSDLRKGAVVSDADLASTRPEIEEQRKLVKVRDLIILSQGLTGDPTVYEPLPIIFPEVTDA